ncbi:unnamed protein product [Notodromas monacha]|uniref:Programmed cell death protein 5 n=1 Tax=Notodromas monacha TaxID=399045 RepID=A0A7R9GAG5_9CRUS|nr:unnamed protein product [Notodromas monacha]CAG0915339.1 unnamed protein product [Notodromas monacha]
MDDPELARIRAQRMATLQAKAGGGGGGRGGGGSERDGEEAERRQQEQEMAKNSILSQALDQAARARLNTLALAKPEKGQMIENLILRMATSGQLRGKMSEQELIGLLEQVSEKSKVTTTVKFDHHWGKMSEQELIGLLEQVSKKSKVTTTAKFDRRRAALDSDDDDF